MEFGLFCATHVLSINCKGVESKSINPTLYRLTQHVGCLCFERHHIVTRVHTPSARHSREPLTDHPARQTNNKRYVYTTCLIHIVCVALPIKLLYIVDVEASWLVWLTT